ncbi:N-acetylmuramoyl-L-alanine amidase [uncultured Flavobacterium sp.]|uniref:N-acetylmuramoyl-L-alanine amidase family protein n=1 Tax=uncultured Flavobacterium sp. TaxID=165435 RepID=UPI0030C7C086
MKKILALLSLCLVVVLLSFTSLNNKKLVVIDAAHGGHDNGAAKNELYEKDIVEQIAKKIFQKNDPSKVEIVLLRDTDNFISLEDRINTINELNPDLVISLHTNYHSENNKSGVEAYVSAKNSQHEASTEQARKLIEAIANEKLQSRGVKQANFMILRKSNCPAITLELGFLSNENDRNYLTSEEGQNEIATNIIKSIQ